MFLCSLWSAFLSKPSGESWRMHSAQFVMNHSSTSTIAHYLAVHVQTGVCSKASTYHLNKTLIGLVVALCRAPTLHLIAADVDARKAASKTWMELPWPLIQLWGICRTSCTYATFAGPIIRCDKMQAGKQNCNTGEHVCWFLPKAEWTSISTRGQLTPKSQLTSGTG